MSGTVTLEQIHNDLIALRKEVAEVKERIVDIDVVLSDDDISSLREAEKDLKMGKTKRLN